MKLFYTEKDTDDYTKTNRQGWQFVGDIHAKTHGHINIDYAETHDLDIVKVSRYSKGDNI